MGEPMKILDLAQQMIRFYGFEPERDIRIVETGLRRGERIHERLQNDREERTRTEFHGIDRLDDPLGPSFTIDEVAEELRPVCFHDPSQPNKFRNRRLAREILRSRMPGVPLPTGESEY
jgi:FlaA1/EpsC-like NDP-sugar epimerase